jgi:hypothetical protein
VKAQIASFPKYYYGDGTKMPFDKAFDLMIPFKQRDSIYYIFLYKRWGHVSFYESMQKTHPPTIKLNSNWVKNKAGDTTYCKVELRYNQSQKQYSLLKPSKTYSLIFIKGINKIFEEDVLKAFKIEYDKTGDILPDGTAYKIFYSLLVKLKKDSTAFIKTPHTDFNEYIQFYCDKLLPLENRLDAKKKEDSDFKFECTGTYLNEDCISKLFNLFNGKGCSPVTIRCVDTCNFVNLILSLTKIRCDNIIPFLKGLGNLSNLDQSDKYVKENRPELRKINITKSLSDLYELKNLILNIKTQLTLKECGDQIYCLNELNVCINKLVNELNNSNKRVSEIIKLPNDIESLKIESRLFIDYSITDVNTYVYNFQTRNELAITPVFGYAYYGFQKGFNGFAPYLGFQINFQGLNRDVPFNQIRRKTLGQIMCFTTAWTLSGIQEQNKRYDLFEKGSLITSLGFKFSHIVMLNGGVLWFKKENPNALITTKSVAVTPILSLSVNLEIEKLLNGITKLIPLK